MNEFTEIDYPEATDEELEPPWDSLDPGIVDRVRVIHEAGLLPWSSCQGGPGHLTWYPHVLIATSLETIDEDARKLVELMVKTGEKNFTVSKSFHYHGNVDPDASFPASIEVSFQPEGPKPWPITEWVIKGAVTGVRISEPFPLNADAPQLSELASRAESLTFQPLNGQMLHLPCTRETYNRVLQEICQRGMFPMQLNVILGDDIEEIERLAQLTEEDDPLPED